MSVMGQERTLAALEFMSVFGGKADEIEGKADIGDCMSVVGGKADIFSTLANVRY